MQQLDVRPLLALIRGAGKYLTRPPQELGLPLRDLVRVHIETRGQLRQRLVAFDGGYRHLRFEYRCVVTAGSSHALCSSGNLSPIVAELHLSRCPILWGHLSYHRLANRLSEESCCISGCSGRGRLFGASVCSEMCGHSNPDARLSRIGGQPTLRLSHYHCPHASVLRVAVVT